MFSAAAGLVVFLHILIAANPVHGQVAGDLRLIRYDNTNVSYSYGRLQVYVAGQWGEVCADNFDKTERDVACHQLGFVSSIDNSTNNSFGDVSDLMLSEVDCLDIDEYIHLLRCDYRTGLHTCAQNYVTLYCNTTRIWDNPYDGQLRLTQGVYTSEGLVQVYCNGEWGTVCTRRFNRAAADLVCRQLGFTSAKRYNHLSIRDYYSPIWLDPVVCTESTEVCLGSCAVCPSAQTRRCSHYYDLTIQCAFEALHYEFGSNVSSCDYVERGYIQSRPRLGEVRLLNSTHSQASGPGIAQVVYGPNNSTTDKRWVPVCGTGSDQDDEFNAQTVCQQLGFDQVSNYYTISSVSPNDAQFSVRCNQQQPHILWCPRNFTACATSLVVTCSYNTSNYFDGQIRLVGGEYPSEGRLEMYYREQWGTITGGNYSYHNYETEGESACRQLGYTGSTSTVLGRLPGSGVIWYYDPYCSFVASCFTQCLYYNSIYDRRGSYYADHNLDIFLNCSFDTSSNVPVTSQSDCDLRNVPVPSGTVIFPTVLTDDTNYGGIIGGVTVSFVTIVVIIMTIIVLTVYWTVRKDKRARRRTGLTTTTGDNVLYTAQGQNVAFGMQPAGYVTPQGMILIPVVPQPLAAAAVSATTASASATTDEEKTEPQSTDEIAHPSFNESTATPQQTEDEQLLQ